MTDEQLLLIIFLENMDNFEIYYGHWTSVFINHKKPVSSTNNIFHQLQKAYSNNDLVSMDLIYGYIKKGINNDQSIPTFV